MVHIGSERNSMQHTVFKGHSEVSPWGEVIIKANDTSDAFPNHVATNIVGKLIFTSGATKDAVSENFA